MTSNLTERRRGRVRGASRDYSQATREQRTRSQDYTVYDASGAPVTAPRKQPREATTPSRARGFRAFVTKPGGRLGSQQVVSQRGRRIAVASTVKSEEQTRLFRVGLCSVAGLIGGVFLAIGLSGASTDQTFTLQQLQAQENQLDNQLETLHRDVELAQASSRLATYAHNERMGVPVQPGVLRVDENGEISEDRTPEGGVREVIDVNDEFARPNAASSNPQRTGELGDTLAPVPSGQAQIPSNPAAPPYAEQPYAQR